MSTIETPEPNAEVQRQLEMANSQLALYARDLKRIVDAERQKARELAEANARLEILDRLKTDFITFISNELRAPLSNIAAVALLDPYGEAKEQARLIDLIRKGYKRLEKFIEKGLEYFQWLATERAEAGEITDLAMLVRLVADHTPGLADPGVDCRLSIPAAPCLVRGEASHLAEVVQTLLDNALKFSQGQKSVKVANNALRFSWERKWIRVEVGTTAEKVTLVVADSGRGFPPELAAKLFQPFTDSDITHQGRGTGLSLARASAIVAAHGGQIRAESGGVGKGATFIVEFPPASAEGYPIAREREASDARSPAEAAQSRKE